jgi:hypothetical protein
MVANMSNTAIHLKNAKKVLFKNVVIRGFNKAIVAENSQATLIGCNIHNNLIGLESYNSNFTITNSIFNNNIDFLIGRNSKIEIIDSIAKTVLDITKNPTSIEEFDIHYIAYEILRTNDINIKKAKLKNLVNKLQKFLRSLKLKSKNVDMAKIALLVEIIKDIMEIIKSFN